MHPLTAPKWAASAGRGPRPQGSAADCTSVVFTLQEKSEKAGECGWLVRLGGFLTLRPTHSHHPQSLVWRGLSPQPLKQRRAMLP